MLITSRKLHRPSFILISICIYLVIMAYSTVTEACGTFVEIGGGGSHTISSGSQYKPYVNCIWLVQTSSGHRLSMDLTFEGDENYGLCGDYVIVEDAAGGVLFDGRDSCSQPINIQITAPASWMRVQFKSDGANTTTGFQGIISSTHVGSSISNYSNPIEGCRSFEWTCPNKVCMTLSYRCDGFNDCGCEGDDCDESGCDGLPLGKYTIMLIGGFLGFGIFLFFFFFAFAYEVHLRRKALMADPEAQAELQKKKADEKRRAAYKKAAKEKKGGAWVAS